MRNSLQTKTIDHNFESYLQGVFLKKVLTLASIVLVILFYYMYSDWYVRNNVLAVATRIIPLILCVVLVILQLILKQKIYKTKFVLYILLSLSLQFMMYGKCLVHLHEEALAASVTGSILVLFLISLDLKLNRNLTLLVYGLPITVFSLVLILVAKPNSIEFFIIADIYPAIVIGYAINRIQYKLRYRLYRSNYLLKSEQRKTKRLYKETLEIIEQLKKSNETKDRFLGIIAHDLKNPIGTIWGLSDLLVLDKSIDEKQKQVCIETINTSVKHTHVLLDNLLTWARAQSQSISYKPLKHNVSTIIDNELKVLKQTAESKSIIIENNISDELQVYVDLQMFETMIRNIVSNAIKYTFAEGRITISARYINKYAKVYSEIIIEDTGVGIPEDRIATLFEVAKNTSTKGTEGEEGTGLGLLLCKEFVDIHNGFIDVESEANKGSTFRFAFPLLN